VVEILTAFFTACSIAITTSLEKSWIKNFLKSKNSSLKILWDETVGKTGTMRTWQLLYYSL
jgi:hypothetical protein